MGHWYKKDGTPIHRIVGKNGRERDTTLRDARKHGLYPSVTGILNVLDKPALNKWKVNQAYLAALTLPRIDGEKLDDFKKRAEIDANAEVEEAKKIGGEIHDSIEWYFKGKRIVKHQESAEAVHNFIVEHTGLSSGWIPEHTFSCEEGYGGMVDLHHESGLWVIDYKTKDDLTKKCDYPEQCMQLSAYSHGLGFPGAKKLNIYVDRSNQGMFKWHEWKDDMYDRFECLLKYWQIVKGYKP
jgi:hypothetical protein